MHVPIPSLTWPDLQDCRSPRATYLLLINHGGASLYSTGQLLLHIWPTSVGHFASCVSQEAKEASISSLQQLLSAKQRALQVRGKGGRQA